MAIVPSYINKQRELLSPHLSRARTVLDFGCGDLSLARALKRARPSLVVTGVDVVDSRVRDPHITFTLYDGKTLPFAGGSFDAVISYHVLHHCDDPESAFGEIVRVAKQSILLVEPVFRGPLDLFFMKIFDRIGNGWRSVAIPMPFTFQTAKTWERWALARGWAVTVRKPAGMLPAWLPFGVTTLFVLTPKKRLNPQK